MHREVRGSTELRRFLYASTGLLCCWSPANKGKGSTGGRSGYSSHARRRGVFLLCALFHRLRGRIHCGVALSAEVEHWCCWDPCLLVPVHSLHDDHSGPAGAAIRGFEPEQIGLRSSGALSHLSLAFTAALLLLRNLILVSFSPSACLYCLAALVEFFNTAARGRPRTSTAPSCSPASGRRLLSSDLSAHRAASDLRGALAKPEWSLRFSAFFHTIVYSGTAGAIYMGHFLAQREKADSNLLGLHVSNGDWLTDQTFMR